MCVLLATQADRRSRERAARQEKAEAELDAFKRNGLRRLEKFRADNALRKAKRDKSYAKGTRRDGMGDWIPEGKVPLRRMMRSGWPRTGVAGSTTRRTLPQREETGTLSSLFVRLGPVRRRGGGGGCYDR